MSSPLSATRAALHAVGELVLAGPQHRASGTIRLRVAPGGFRTCAAPDLAVVGPDLVHDGRTFAIAGRTPRELAALVGVTAGAPDGLYGDGADLDVDTELVVDDTAVAQLCAAYATGDAALRLLAPDVEPVLWPEHFDVAIRVDDVNYGVSPGDGFLDEPYAYVGVDPVPSATEFWNAPFGAARPMTAFADASAVRDFFVRARH